MKATARTAAQKLRAKRGRPRRDGVPRTEDGRISRSFDAQTAEERIAVEAATWKRRQDNPLLTIEEARKQEHGSVIHRWKLDYQRIAKKYPDGTHQNTFTPLHLDTAERYHKLHLDYHAIIGAMPPRSTSEVNRVPSGYDGSDPFSGERSRREEKIAKDYKAARETILGAGPLCQMAVMAVVVENKDCPSLMGDLRLALNALSILWKLQAAA